MAKSDIIEIVKQIEALPASQQLHLTAGLLERGEHRVAYRIVDRVAKELGAGRCCCCRSRSHEPQTEKLRS